MDVCLGLITSGCNPALHNPHSGSVRVAETDIRARGQCRYRSAWFHTPPLCEGEQDPKRRRSRPLGRRSRRQPSARRPGRGQGPCGLEAGSGGWPPLSELGRRPPCLASVDRHPEGRNRAAGSGRRRRRRVGRGPKGTPSAIQPFCL